MAIVRPSVTGYMRDPRAAAWEDKWNKINANTGKIAAMVPQAMLRQYAIDESLRQAEQRAQSAEQDKVFAATTGPFAWMDQDIATREKALEVTTQAEVDAMKAHGAAGTPRVSVSVPDPNTGARTGKGDDYNYASQTRTVTTPAEERLAKMLRFEELAAREGVEVAATNPQVMAKNAELADLRSAAAMQSFDDSKFALPDAMMAAAVAEDENRKLRFVEASMRSTPGLQTAIMNNPKVNAFWQTATNHEKYAWVQQVLDAAGQAGMTPDKMLAPTTPAR